MGRTGEQKLLEAVLMDAVKILFGLPIIGCGVPIERLEAEALLWLHADWDGPTSFARICHEFHMNESWLRQRILTERRRRLRCNDKKRVYWSPHKVRKEMVA